MRSGQPLRSGSTSSMTRAIESWPAFRSPPSRPHPALVGEDQVDRTLPASCRSSVTAGATTDLAVERLHQMQPETSHKRSGGVQPVGCTPPELRNPPPGATLQLQPLVAPQPSQT